MGAESSRPDLAASALPGRHVAAMASIPPWGVSVSSFIGYEPDVKVKVVLWDF